MALIKGKQVDTGVNGIATANIVDLNVTTGKINDLAVTTGKIDDLAVTTGKLDDLAVTTGKIDDLAVTTGKLDDLAVTTGKLDDLAVTTGKLDDNAVTPDKADLSQVWAFTAEPTYNADPTGANGLTRKSYVDAIASGIDWKQSVRAATTVDANITTAYENGDVIDGVTLVTGDRILLAGQNVPHMNGLYVVAVSGAPNRSADADTSAKVTSGLAVFVEEGTDNGDKAFVLVTNNPIVLDTTGLVFSVFSSTGGITAGDGLYYTGGNTLNVGAGDGIQVNADDVEVLYGLAAAITTVDADSAQAAGTENTAARADHEHAVTTGAATGLDADSTNTEGAGADLARASHTHAISSAAPSTTVKSEATAAATGTAASFLRSDAQIQVETAVPATTVKSDAAAPAQGTASSLLRSDAQLVIATAAPSNVGTANAQGTSQDLARADHVHDSPAPATGNKSMTASVTTADFDPATATTIALTPALGSYVGATVNGLEYEIGDGVKTKDAYFSGNGGTTARAFGAIVAGDTLYWVGSVAGFQLEASDRISLNYLAF